MLESRAKEFKVFTEDELVVDPTQRQRDGPALYKWMSGAFYGFKRNEHVVFFNAGDVEAVDARET